MKIRNKKLLTKSIAMAIFMSSTLYTMPITHAAFNNNTVPSNGTVVAGVINGSNNNIISDPTNITQTTQNAVIKWDDFSVGANTTVNFNGPSAGFNTLNYVDSGNLSQIYGTINATNGNIYIVNPAGVQIGNSAQINVGSLYVSNKSMSDDQLKAFQSGAKVDTPYTIQGNRSNAELMSLGNINAANKVTFDGNRIVLDVDRVKNGQTPLGADNITIKTTQTDLNNKNVVLGYTAYDSVNKTYKGKNDNTSLAKLEGISGKTELTKNDGFMWVKDGEQLQAMNTNLGGNYAFRNSIDLNSTADKNVTFNSVGDSNNAFTGNLDGLGNEVYGLHIDEKTDNTGLFAKTDGATIRNFNLISGSIISTENNAGAVVGNANNTVIENVKNTINVTGTDNVGGIIGTGTKVTLNGVVNAGAIKGNSNVGGLAGSLVGSLTAGSTLKGESYNLGDIKGTVNNIGGLVGSASHSTIGNKTGFQMYNHLDVEGGYNVGGIVGNLEDGSTVQNVSNDGNIKATRYIGDKYSYHTNNAIEANDSKVNLNKAGEAKKDVHISNVGGIVGNSTGDTDIADSIKTTNIIKDVLNNGDVSAKLDTTTNSNMPYYTAGNVGGVVGSAVNTDISNATNKENDVRGAHNVGGIVGYFEDGTITKAINNGGDIMATGARNEDGFVTEFVRYDSSAGGNESFIVGNIGGIVGYMYGEDAYINTSANRGTVHTEDIVDEGNILDTSKAANVGGIVGKIDRSTTISMDNIKKPTNGQQNKYAISNSYNTGNVRGYTGVGGVAGMMYNGEIVGSYNIGEIRSTRKDTTSVSPLNMGGIVGDSTEETSAKISLYDVYNKGQIGDEEFVYKGRHVGGIAGRLSGDVEKSYNNGDIYNGATVTGGIAGWWVKGDITNSFNTGNITNYSTTYSANGSNVGGIAGGMGIYQTDLSSKLENVYNLGTIRSIKGASSNTTNTVGGMIGTIGGAKAPGRLTIKNVYTLGNLYSVDNGTATAVTKMIGSYYTGSHNVTISNAYYINTTNNKNINIGTNPEGSKTPQAPTKLISESDSINGKLEDVYEGFNSNDWRIYKGTTPILNAFMPESSGYLKDEKLNNGLWSSLNISSVQYGTAYDPLLTIINAQDSSKNVNLDWQKLGIYGDGGLAVYNSGLTLDNFKNSDKGVGLFGGIIYSDGALNIKSYDGDENTAENIAENIGLGSFSKIYGSSVTIDAGETGTVDAYGSIISTGNKTQGDITITGANVNTYGEIKTAVKEGQTTTIEGIKGSINNAYDDGIKDSIKNQNAEIPNIAEGYAHTVTAGANSTGDVSITATDGDVNIYYGNMEKGIIDTQGNVNLEGKNIYVDSDMVIGGNLTADTGKNSAGEIVLDISNIGKVSLKQYTNNLYKALANSSSINSSKDIENIIGQLETKINLKEEQLEVFANYLFNEYIDKTSHKLNSNATESAISDAIIKGRMHNFLKSFEKPATDTEKGKYINFAGTDNAKITVDMWDYNTNTFDLDKYDLNGKTLSSKLDALNVTGNNNETGKDFVYIWVADGEQLKGIQNYANKDTNSKILSYNFALKNDINATDVKDYQAIGSGDTAFTGKFDGRGNRIIGLNVSNSNDNVGVFGVNAGTIKNLKVYSSTFKGYDNVGAIAGTNNGTIDNVTTLGNTVEASGSAYSVVGAAGGVVGTNNGTVNNATSRDSVIAGQNSNEVLTIAGGIAGINTGLVANSQSHSAVIASKTSTYSLGGIVGVNTAKDNIDDNKITAGLDNVNAYGVTGSSILVDNTGGIAGLNSGTLNDAYNESIVKGSSNVGGIAGTNSGEISLIVNGASVTAEGEYTGGLVGSTTGKISDGRNNGVITGNDYVGGLVGSNGKDVILTNLTNDSSAEIIGENYVGGIAGRNDGIITAKDQTNLINRGSITGQNYVGGIAGKNNGTIANVNNDIVLNVKDEGKTAEYFGGVTGINEGTITNATNRGNINASGASYVGGITGQNDGTLSGAGNKGKVTGKDYVGGVAGLNTKAVIGTVDNIIGIKNEGTVIAEAGGAGGIFGKNKANIQYAEFVNSGKVTGTAGTLSGTGGIFGENTGNIDHSSLKNEVNGNVSGVNNVGGLIGINSGTIEGGRDEASHYYKYQIYNNGTITATGNGSNIGGLIGENTSIGSLTAGYNTGVIDASNSSNVGGIVGTNEGTVKEVFNTIAGNGSVTGNTNVGSVTGNTSVGGLIGTNSGTLSNAYSTSFVEGNTDVGNVVGDNTSGTVTNIYATNTKGNLIGTNNGTINTSYSFSSSDKNKTNITYLETEADQKDKDNYTSFDDKNTWKFYDGNANPLLKVFLTKAEFVPAKDNEGNNVKPNFVYNGKQQGVLISYNKDKNLVEVLDAKNTVIGTIKVANEDAAHSLEDYINTIGQGNQLINGVQFIDAGTYEMLFSQQINTDGEKGNPNNLGFDFVTSLDNTNPDSNNPPTITNDKAQINITLNDIERIYGNLNINSGNYGFTYGIANGQLTDEMEKELLNKLQLGTVDTTKDDGALIENGTKTNNANKDNENYYWTGTVTLDNSLLSNYEFTNNSNSIKVNNGKSTVKKADLVIDLNDVKHTYGSPNLNDYGVSSVTGLTNGDKANIGVTMTEDTALKDENTHTNNAGGSYTWTGNISGLEGIENNYNITVNNGKSTVDKGHLTITVDDSNTTVGDNPNYGGTVDGWANGDNPNDFDINFGLDDDSIIGQPGKHDGVIGVIIDGTFYPSGTEDDVFNNYDVTINAGDLTVLKPFDINDNKNWSHLYKDAPWDRNRDFKERKAEFNFVDGAIPLDEAVEEV
ncbi:beta strand repeat-containing protein [Megamonas funiformis]|uniref:beta strand repeat-containing protein n=1 Tax=Megamonas funiformis TaxID=437897 RepID=UPI00388F2E3F